MLMDKFLMFSDDQAITASAVCSNPVALAEVAKLVEAGGEPMEICVQVTEDFADSSGSDATLVVNFLTGNSAVLGGAQVHFATTTIPVAQLVVGKKIKVPFNLSVADADASHFGVSYTVASGPFNAGKVTAWLQRVNEDQNGLV